MKVKVKHNSETHRYDSLAGKHKTHTRSEQEQETPT